MNTIFKNNLFNKNIPKWLHLEIMVILDKWNFELGLYEKSGSLSRSSEAIEAYERLYFGTEYAFQKLKDEETKKMAEKISKNKGVFVIPELAAMFKEEEKSYTILSESIKIKDSRKE